MAKKMIPNVAARNKLKTPLANVLDKEELTKDQHVKQNIVILDELRDLIPPLQDEESQQLEDNISKEGVREPLLLWAMIDGRFAIVDGHNRYRIAQKLEKDFNYQFLKFPNITEAKDWMINNQLGRRNLSPMQASYLRGQLYNATKQQKGGYDNVIKGRSNPQNEELINGENPQVDSIPQNEVSKDTSAMIAERYSVSKNTIQRDGKFAEAIDAIGKVNREVKQDLLAGKTKANKQDIQTLAKAKPEELVIDKPEDISREADKVRKTAKIKKPSPTKEIAKPKRRWTPEAMAKTLDSKWYSEIPHEEWEGSRHLHFLDIEIGEKNFDAVLFAKDTAESSILIGSLVFTSIEELANAVLDGLKDSGADYVLVGVAGDADPADMPEIPEGFGVLSFGENKTPQLVRNPQKLSPESSGRSGLLEGLLGKLL